MLYPYPENSSDTLYMRVIQPITGYSSGTETVSLPPEYRSALVYNLARDFASEFNLEVPSNVAARAVETVSVLKNLHSEPVPQMNTNPMGIGGSAYDITTDDT